MNHKTFFAGLSTAILLAVAACGGNDDEALTEQETGFVAVEDSVDLSDMPADFPRELVPPSYDNANYLDLGHINGTRASTFESTADVQESIDYYVGLLGEPKINVDSGDGDRLVQWHESPYPPWVVGVMGNAGETIVTVSTIPQQ